MVASGTDCMTVGAQSTSDRDAYVMRLTRYELVNL